MRRSAEARSPYRRPIRIALTVALAAACVWLFFAFLFEPLLPFLLAALLAALLQKPLYLLDKRTGQRRYGRRIISAALVLLVFGALTVLCAFLISRLLSEGRELAVSLTDNVSTLAAMLDDALSRLSDFFSSLPVIGARDGGERGLLSALVSSLDTLLLDLVQSAITALSARLPAVLTAVASAMPRILLFLAVWLMATLYLTPAWHDIGVFITKYFPERSAAVLRGVRSSLFATLLSWAKAYAILITLTFIELYIGLSVLGVPYALGLSALIALIDVLPVLGVGTVLIPWALLSLVWGDVRLGIGLLVLYAVISVVRQLCEPRIVGAQIGLHPLLALFSMYVGAQLFGIAGLFLMPMAAAVAARYLTQRRERAERETAKDEGETKEFPRTRAARGEA